MTRRSSSLCNNVLQGYTVRREPQIAHQRFHLKRTHVQVVKLPPQRLPQVSNVSADKSPVETQRTASAIKAKLRVRNPTARITSGHRYQAHRIDGLTRDLHSKECAANNEHDPYPSCVLHQYHTPIARRCIGLA